MFSKPNFSLLPFALLVFLSAQTAFGQDASKEAKANPVDLAQRADVLIVTSSELADAWQGFADWKTSTGRPAKIVTTETIEKQFSGDDIQQKIRACCLKHIKQHQTKWVVLGGDSSGDAGVVPDRDSDHTDCKILPYADIPTDLYYISEKDWDANDDGKYGVFADDMEAVAYFNPNATIGRIPVRTAVDVKAYTEKVIGYESRYPTGDFAHRMVYTCPEKVAYLKLETSMEEVGKSWPAGNVSRFFGNQTPWDGEKKGDYDLTPDNWVKMINSNQASKMHMHGHGVLDYWVLEKDKKVKKDSVAKLNNENAYPIITTVSCLTGQYDNKTDPSIGELMLRKPKGGAIAILAPSRQGAAFMKDKKDFRLMITEGKLDGTTTAYTEFWKIALSEDLTLGEAFRKVKMEMESDARENDGFHMVQCELNLLGDPTLSVRALPPKNFEAQVKISGNQLTVRGVPDAKVCVWDSASQYYLLEADKSGKLEFTLPETKGEYRVTATAPGHNIWTSEKRDAPKTAVDPVAKADDAKPDDAKPDAEPPKAKVKGRSLDEFKNYVADKISNLDDTQLNDIAEATDTNGDGIVSDDEFENRMEAVRQVLIGEPI